MLNIILAMFLNGPQCSVPMEHYDRLVEVRYALHKAGWVEGGWVMIEIPGEVAARARALDATYSMRISEISDACGYPYVESYNKTRGRTRERHELQR